jgi:hypothetical protein
MRWNRCLVSPTVHMSVASVRMSSAAIYMSSDHFFMSPVSWSHGGIMSTRLSVCLVNSHMITFVGFQCNLDSISVHMWSSADCGSCDDPLLSSCSIIFILLNWCIWVASVNVSFRFFPVLSPQLSPRSLPLLLLIGLIPVFLSAFSPLLKSALILLLPLS